MARNLTYCLTLYVRGTEQGEIEPGPGNFSPQQQQRRSILPILQLHFRDEKTSALYDRKVKDGSTVLTHSRRIDTQLRHVAEVMALASMGKFTHPSFLPPSLSRSYADRS
jgi:hypothetical protein